MFVRKLKVGLLVVAGFVLLGAEGEGCTRRYQSEADAKQQTQMAQLNAEAVRQIGPPNIVNFQEKRVVKWLYELRDQADLVTYTYVQDLNGHLHYLCTSFGYGVPASVQFSAPSYPMNPGRFESQVLPQAEPNGLFMPEGLSATYVICVFKGERKAVYVEQTLLVSPVPLNAETSLLLGVQPPGMG